MPWKHDDGDNDPIRATAQANVPVRSKESKDATELDNVEVPGSQTVADTTEFSNSLLEDSSATAQVEAAGFSELPSTNAAVQESETRIQQLKAALSADVERSLEAQEQSNAGHPLRVRAESLMRRSQDLLHMGQLNEARRAALQAVEISEFGRIEFLPTEDRPLDLLRKIEHSISRRGDAPAALEDNFTADAPVESVSSDDQTPDNGLTPVASGESQLPPVPSEAAGTVEIEDNVLVAANRPVLLKRDGTYSETSSPQIMNPLPVMGFEDAPRTVELTAAAEPRLTTLPPFRGQSTTDAAIASGPALESPPVAPAPPDVEDLEPLPSLPIQTSAAVAEELVQSYSRPLFAVESLMWAMMLLGVICGCVGGGLLLRQLRERWSASSRTGR